MNFLLTRDWAAMKLGFRRLAYISYEPPNHLIMEVPGVANDGGSADPTFMRPTGVLKTEVVLRFNIRARLRLLLSGKVQVVGVVWTMMPAEVAGDAINWAVLPPYDKVNPNLIITPE